MNKSNKSKFVETHIPCPSCGSSDAGGRNGDGSIYCFSCETLTQPEGEPLGGTSTSASTKIMTTTSKKGDTVYDLKKEVVEGIKFKGRYRGITKETFNFYGVTCNYDRDRKVSKVFFPYYNKDGVLVATKMRQADEKKVMPFSGNPTRVDTLFGEHKFKNITNDIIFITEGEYDAMVLYQEIGRPAVSIKNGCGGVERDVKQSYQFLDRFKEVYVCFDNDPQGLSAIEKAIQLLPTNKVKVATAIQEGCKDPNDYLLKGFADRIKADFWWNATKKLPFGVVTDVKTLRLRVEEEVKRQKEGVPYPWEGLNEKTSGMRLGEVVVYTAGTGAGKSQLMREIQHHLLKETNDNIGLLMLEETIGRTSLGIMGIEADSPLHLPDIATTKEERDDFFNKTIGTGRFKFYEGYSSFSLEHVKNCIEYLAKAEDCKWFFVDHISIMVSGGNQTDERKELDRIATVLAQLAVELQVHIAIISHLKRNSGLPHEEGGRITIQDLRGTQGIGQVAFLVIGLERNQQADTEEERNTTTLRVLKNRPIGKTGKAGELVFDELTGRLKENSNEYLLTEVYNTDRIEDIFEEYDDDYDDDTTTTAEKEKKK